MNHPIIEEIREASVGLGAEHGDVLVRINHTADFCTGGVAAGVALS